jgi:hypothetical protein
MLLRRCAAYHESGHAVVALALGCQVSWAEISERCGRVSYSSPRNARDDALVLFAGTLAQRRAEPASPMGKSDSRAVAALDPQMAMHWRREARAMVDQHWPLIEDVATRPLERGRLDGIEIYQVCLGLQAEWCS